LAGGAIALLRPNSIMSRTEAGLRAKFQTVMKRLALSIGLDSKAVGLRQHGSRDARRA